LTWGQLVVKTISGVPASVRDTRLKPGTLWTAVGGRRADVRV